MEASKITAPMISHTPDMDESFVWRRGGDGIVPSAGKGEDEADKPARKRARVCCVRLFSAVRGATDAAAATWTPEAKPAIRGSAKSGSTCIEQYMIAFPSGSCMTFRGF